jgi:uracil-DNA glycosylase family 4
MQSSNDPIRDFFLQQEELFTDEFYFESKPNLEKISQGIDRSPALGWDELKAKALVCTRCPLAKTRLHVVFGVGDSQTNLLFIGEAPGEQEDLKGEPFVGRAGQLLDKILAAIQMKREQVYITNILKCRPPNNRSPHASEIEQCEPYLLNQIDLIQPKLIVCLGLVAAKTLLRVEYNLQQMRGKIYNYHGFDLMVTYHPAALLRNPYLKKFAWEDFQKIRDLYHQKESLNRGS